MKKKLQVKKPKRTIAKKRAATKVIVKRQRRVHEPVDPTIPPAAESETHADPDPEIEGQAVAGPGPTDGNGSPVHEEEAQPA